MHRIGLQIQQWSEPVLTRSYRRDGPSVSPKQLAKVLYYLYSNRWSRWFFLKGDVLVSWKSLSSYLEDYERHLLRKRKSIVLNFYVVHAIWYVIELSLFFFSPTFAQLWMFDLYRYTDRFWHEISRANELCSQRSGSKVRLFISWAYLMGVGWRWSLKMKMKREIYRASGRNFSLSCIFLCYLWKTLCKRKR